MSVASGTPLRRLVTRPGRVGGAGARSAPPHEAERGQGTALPWYTVALALAATSATIGLIWDVSWHRSIGRDTFWTPAHLAIYLAGVLGGGTSGWLVFKTTFARGADKSAAASFWGLRGPFGAWVCIWGALAMLTSAPFDNWWHNAYGLDVKVVSPPHVVLMLGSLAIRIGTLALLAGLMNRAQEELRRKLAWLFFYVAATCVGQLALLILEPTWLVRMHSA